ncbi:hypothetical protein G1K73_06985, partial [Tenacibaculum finnmarkense]
NKFLMRAASAAQKASDFVLNLDANNVPAFYKELGKITVPKKTVKETSTKKTTSIPDSSAYPVAVPETKITIKANAPFNSCGRLRKGWKFQNGKPVQVIPKKKATKKAEIKKVVVKKIEKPTKTVKRPSKEVVLKDRINQEGNYIKQITAFLKETRAKSKKTAKDKKNINYWVIAIKEAKKRKSLNEKLLKELGEILTPKKNDVTIYAYNKITAKEMAVYSDDELYLLYRAIAKQQNKTGIDKELIRYNRGVIIKALRHPLKHYSYLDKTYNFVLDELIEEKKLHDHAILGHDAHMYSDKVIAKGYAYANLARFIYFYRLSFPFYKRTKLLKEAQNPELRKLFEKEIKKRKLKVNVQAVVPITPEQKAIKRKRDKAKTVVKPTPIKLGNPKNPENPKKTNSLAYKMANRQNKVSEIYKIRDKNISEFLGEIEVKQKESVVITLTGGQGSMKTRCAFRFMNAFAQKYKVGHASIEEHPESTLYYNKVDEYINDNALNNIHNPEINSISDLDKLVKENDIIVIDSFAKMQEIQKGFEVDKDLRKKYDGKLFIVIFQQTTDGKMRGGSKSQFDADIILFTEKFDNYQNNYIYADKNRYQNKNLTDLKYNIFEGVLKDLE